MTEDKFYTIANRICEIEEKVGFGHNRYDGAMNRVEIWDKEITTIWEDVVGTNYPYDKEEWHDLMSVWTREIKAIENRIDEIEKKTGFESSELQGNLRISIADGELQWESVVGYDYPNEKEEWSSLMSQWLCYEQLWEPENKDSSQWHSISEYDALEEMKLKAQALVKILIGHQELNRNGILIPIEKDQYSEHYSPKYLIESDFKGEEAQKALEQYLEIKKKIIAKEKELHDFDIVLGLRHIGEIRIYKDLVKTYDSDQIKTILALAYDHFLNTRRDAYHSSTAYVTLCPALIMYGYSFPYVDMCGLGILPPKANGKRLSMKDYESIEVDKYWKKEYYDFSMITSFPSWLEHKFPDEYMGIKKKYAVPEIPNKNLNTLPARYSTTQDSKNPPQKKETDDGTGWVAFWLLSE